jgi:hypothetical protein
LTNIKEPKIRDKKIQEIKMNIARNNKKIMAMIENEGILNHIPPIISFGHEIGTMFDYC